MHRRRADAATAAYSVTKNNSCGTLHKLVHISLGGIGQNENRLSRSTVAVCCVCVCARCVLCAFLVCLCGCAAWCRVSGEILLMTTGTHNQLIRSTERERFGLDYYRYGGRYHWNVGVFRPEQFLHENRYRVWNTDFPLSFLVFVKIVEQVATCIFSTKLWGRRPESWRFKILHHFPDFGEFAWSVKKCERTKKNQQKWDKKTGRTWTKNVMKKQCDFKGKNLWVNRSALIRAKKQWLTWTDGKS